MITANQCCHREETGAYRAGRRGDLDPATGRRGLSAHWTIMRNRLGAAVQKNTRDASATFEIWPKRIGFCTVKGFGERVIFRELFLQGLTLMDVRDAGVGIWLGMSHVAARVEVRALIGATRKPTVTAGRPADCEPSEQAV